MSWLSQAAGAAKRVTSAQWYAAGRHVLTFAAGGVTVLASVHVLSPTDAQNATTALQQIGSGVLSVITGLSTLAGIVSGLYATWSASPKSQLLSVASNPDVKVVVANPVVAAQTPSDKVVSPAQAKKIL